VKRGTGFIYYVSREGVTGMRSSVSENIGIMTSKIRQHTKLPIAVGFGISNPEQARMVAANAEAVVVGSAVVNQVAAHGKSPALVQEVSQFVKTLADAVKTVPHAPR
jgi:tryptophan synthase alpha chain